MVRFTDRLNSEKPSLTLTTTIHEDLSSTSDPDRVRSVRQICEFNAPPVPCTLPWRHEGCRESCVDPYNINIVFTTCFPSSLYGGNVPLT